jgi:hypothetical protein
MTPAPVAPRPPIHRAAGDAAEDTATGAPAGHDAAEDTATRAPAGHDAAEDVATRARARAAAAGDDAAEDVAAAAVHAVTALASPAGAPPARSRRLLAGDARPVTGGTLPGLAGGAARVLVAGGRTARLHNAVMEEIFTAMRAGAGAGAALASGRLPERGAAPVFRCSLVHGAEAAIANPSLPSHSVNFYELEPSLEGAPFEPGTPLPPGVWRVTWTCPSYPAARGGPAAGAFHLGVGVGAGALPAATAANAAGPVPGAPGNLALPALPGRRLAAALRRLAGARELAERDGCAAVAGFVAAKAARVRNPHPTLFDRDDALQEGLARLVVLMRRFAARGRPRACWSVAAGLVLERDLPRAADRVSHLPSNVAHCAHWLVMTDTVDHHDPHLTPEAAAAAYAREQRRRQSTRPRTRSWLDGATGTRPAYSPQVWRQALNEARRGRPVSLEALCQAQATDTQPPAPGDLVPVADRDLELVGERALADLLADLLAGTGLTFDDLRAYLHPRLARRDYPREVLGGPDAGGDGRALGARDAGDEAARARRAREVAENRLLALVAMPGESPARHRARLRERVRGVLFDPAGRYRPTAERVRLWEQHRAASTAGADHPGSAGTGPSSPGPNEGATGGSLPGPSRNEASGSE